MQLERQGRAETASGTFEFCAVNDNMKYEASVNGSVFAVALELKSIFMHICCNRILICLGFLSLKITGSSSDQLRTSIAISPFNVNTVMLHLYSKSLISIH